MRKFFVLLTLGDAIAILPAFVLTYLTYYVTGAAWDIATEFHIPMPIRVLLLLLALIVPALLYVMFITRPLATWIDRARLGGWPFLDTHYRKGHLLIVRLWGLGAAIVRRGDFISTDLKRGLWYACNIGRWEVNLLAP